jgi:hypothetical protein
MGRVTDLEQELSEPPEGRVFVVPDRIVDGFNQVMEGCGIVVEPVGEWNGMHLYWNPRGNSSGGVSHPAKGEPAQKSLVQPKPSIGVASDDAFAHNP